MPDAGDFERDEAQRGSPGWGDAFAALPQETPDSGGWQRVQARLPATAARSRTRWPLWLATAASLALAAVIPLRMLPQATTDAPAPASQAVATSASPHPVAAAAAGVATPSDAVDSLPIPTPVAKRDATRRATRTPPSQRPIRTAAGAADATRIAATAEVPASTDLEPLYAQSAQLESLLAMARDDRVASGTRAALSHDLDARVAAIDATLIQPGLSDVQRSDLWSQRVDALQQLVGIETTNRLYAARGQRYDAALVSID